MTARFLFRWCTLGGLAIAWLLPFCFSQNEQAMVQSRYDAGKAFAQSGNYAAALNELLWCFDEGMPKVPAFRGVRTSFLLSEIGRLMKPFPLAREALIERRDAAENRALSDPQDRNAVTDFGALCATLEEDARLVKFYDALPKSDPRRRALGLRAFRIFLVQQRYADAVVVVPFENMTALWKSRATRPTPVADPRIQETLLRSMLNNGLDYVEALAGAGELEHAQEMIGYLVEVDASRETQRLLEERLKRAGHPELLKPSDAKDPKK